MCYRNSDRGRRRDRRADSGNHADADILRAKRGVLFAATTKHEWVAAFESNDSASTMRKPNQQPVDCFLTPLIAVASALSDVDASSRRSRLRDECRIDQPVVDHDVGLLERPKAAHRDETGCARPRADEVDHPAPSRFIGLSVRRHGR
jgi:hypothetical protein